LQVWGSDERPYLETLDMSSTFSDLEAAKNSKEDLARGYYYSDGQYHEKK
jgi:hypothetical protein